MHLGRPADKPPSQHYSGGSITVGRTLAHGGWESFLRAERDQLAERAAGKLARDIGLVLPDEAWEELNRLAREDEDRARQGLLELRQGERVWHKHINDLTREDHPARIKAKRVWATWLRSRVERMKTEQRDRYS